MDGDIREQNERGFFPFSVCLLGKLAMEHQRWCRNPARHSWTRVGTGPHRQQDASKSVPWLLSALVSPYWRGLRGARRMLMAGFVLQTGEGRELKALCWRLGAAPSLSWALGVCRLGLRPWAWGCLSSVTSLVFTASLNLHYKNHPLLMIQNSTRPWVFPFLYKFRLKLQWEERLTFSVPFNVFLIYMKFKWNNEHIYTHTHSHRHMRCRWFSIPTNISEHKNLRCFLLLRLKSEFTLMDVIHAFPQNKPFIHCFYF